MSWAPLEIPAEDGRLVAAPPVVQWASLVEDDSLSGRLGQVSLAGVPALELRDQARTESLRCAQGLAQRMGTPAPSTGPDAPIVMTGHQPLLYHPGVWVKALLVDDVAQSVGGTGIECIVDSDAFERIALTVPCSSPVKRCSIDLASGTGKGYFAATPPPDQATLKRFLEDGLEVLETLGLPQAVQRFEEFFEMLSRAAAGSGDAAETTTRARREWERPLDTRYSGLSVTEQGSTASFLTFLASIALDAERFREAHDGALAGNRAKRRLRSKVRPFPDLRTEDDLIELPFWYLDGVERSSLWVRPGVGGGDLLCRGETVGTVESTASGPRVEVEGSIAPRAVTLTLFNRLFVADLFVHGSGGSAYDTVTDEISTEFFGIEAPPFASATMTLHLPLELPPPPDERMAQVRQRIHELEHNPDRSLAGQAELAPELIESMRLKEQLVREISSPGADKKSLGQQIRQINAGMADAVAPLRVQMTKELELLEEERKSHSILTDRVYPFFLWDPQEVASVVADSFKE